MTEIVDVVSKTVKLQRRGSSLVGICPFHKETSPSFHVNPAHGFWHCFGCHESGDAARFSQLIGEGYRHEETMIQRLWIPGRVPSLNELLQAKSTVFGKGKSRRDGYAQIKRKWEQVVALAIRKVNIKTIEWAGITFEFWEPNKRRDPDGFCSSGTKLILDALTKCRVIPTDGWKGIAYIRYSWHVAGSPKGVGVMVTLEEVDDGECPF